MSVYLTLCHVNVISSMFVTKNMLKIIFQFPLPPEHVLPVSRESLNLKLMEFKY